MDHMVLSGMPSAASVRVMNMAGQEVMTWDRVPGLNGLTVSVQDWPNGVYLVRAESASGAVRTARVVVRH
jgi:hypothetical protein